MICTTRLSRLLVAAIGLGTAGACLAPVAPAAAAPEPSIVPSRWQLDLRPGDLRLAVMDVETTRRGPGGEAYTTMQPTAFLYLTYEVVNNSGEDLLFAPSFQLATEEGEILRSGRNVPTEVVRTLLERLENPFLEDEISVIRTLEQGIENAREGLVVWPAEELKTDEIKIFARGFSGETKRIVRPDTGEEVTLYKELMLRHATPGDLSAYSRRAIPRVESRWILR